MGGSRNPSVVSQSVRQFHQVICHVRPTNEMPTQSLQVSSGNMLVRVWHVHHQLPRLTVA
jgi:hypothetical protein